MSERRYRVWCLSWDDDEEDGRDVVGYDPSTQHRPRGAVAVVRLTDAREAVLGYAEWAHNTDDGSECTWPLTFRVRKPDGTTEDFEVEREFEPTFYASSSTPQQED